MHKSISLNGELVNTTWLYQVSSKHVSLCELSHLNHYGMS